MGAFVGIDLGTTFSAVARVDEHGRPVVVPNGMGRPITPSVIYFGADPPVVGDEAKAAQATGAEVAAFFKRSMGDTNFRLFLGGKGYSPVDLSAIVLRHLKAEAERVMKQPISHAVITVPAYFTNAQREATIEAGRQAGLDVLRIINEPTAAALAYGLQQTKATEVVLVYDLGGGTFDVTLVRISPDSIDVLGTDGDHNLGGKDWDDRLARHLCQRFQAEHGVDPLDDTTSYNDLLVRVEDAKKALTHRTSVSVALHHAGQKASFEVTREHFEALTGDLMKRTQLLTERVLSDARVSWDDLAGALLVGGSTRMPMVHDYVRRMSGKAPRTGVNVDEAVALGAALQAAADMQVLRPTSGKTYRLAGQRKVQDVISHSLGMVAINDDGSRYVNSLIIPKNGPIPATQTRPFVLATRPGAPNKCEVYVTQGESEQPILCTFLGKYVFQGVPHHPTGQAVLDVSYAYDRNGVVQVSAVDRHSKTPLGMDVEPLPEDMSWVERPPARPPARQHVTAYLAFDLSGSMWGDPLLEAQKAARAFISQTDLAGNSLGLISFADTVQTTAAACQDARRLEMAVNSMAIGTVGGGNEASPFAHTHALLHSVTGPRYIIVLTDGVWSYQDRAAEEARQCHRDGIEIIAIGLGGADKAFLDRIATSESSSYFTSLSGLVETFGTIARAITEGGGGLRRK